MKNNFKIKISKQGGFNMEKETFLPVFSGFYGSFWELDFDYIENEIDEARKEKGLYSEYNIDNLKIDYTSFENDVVKGFAEALKNELEDFIVKIEVQDIIHPKEYNFKNDSVNVKIEYKPEALTAFIYGNKASFEKFLKARYTSRDGFISFYSNDFESWEKDTENFTDFSKNGHILGAVLDFIAKEKKIEELDFFDYVMQNIYALNYAENLDEVIEYTDGSLYDFLTKNDISRSFAEYIQRSYDNRLLDTSLLSENILSIIWEFEASRVEA
jgi:hypothetical protein